MYSQSNDTLLTADQIGVGTPPQTRPTRTAPPVPGKLPLSSSNPTLTVPNATNSNSASPNGDLASSDPTTPRQKRDAPPVPARTISMSRIDTSSILRSAPPVPPKPTLHKSGHFSNVPAEVKELANSLLPPVSPRLTVIKKSPDGSDEEPDGQDGQEEESGTAETPPAPVIPVLTPPPDPTRDGSSSRPLSGSPSLSSVHSRPLPSLPSAGSDSSAPGAGLPGSRVSGSAKIPPIVTTSATGNVSPATSTPASPRNSGDTLTDSSATPISSARSSGEATALTAGFDSHPTSPRTSSNLTSPRSSSNLTSPRNSGHEEDDRHRDRTHIVKELQKTEQFYLKGLEVIVKNCYIPLSVAVNTPKTDLLTTEQLKFLFSNAEVIYNINKQFSQDLDKALEDWSPTAKVGSVFLSICPFLKVYNEYVNNYNNCLTTYETCMKNKKFRKFIEESLVLPNTISTIDNLPSYLIMPVQRIPRYMLLLTELFKKTPKDHPDQKDLEMALGKIQAVAEAMNVAKREAENIHKVAEIQKDLQMPEDSKFKYKVIVTTNRRFVREAKLDVYENGEKSPNNYVLLFNDAVIFCKPKKKGYIYHLFFYLKRISLIVDADKLGITLTGITKAISVTIMFESDTERQLWLKELSNRSTPDLRPEDQMSDQDDFFYTRKTGGDDEGDAGNDASSGAPNAKKDRPKGKSLLERARFKTLGSGKDKKKISKQTESHGSVDDNFGKGKDQKEEKKEPPKAAEPPAPGHVPTSAFAKSLTTELSQKLLQRGAVHSASAPPSTNPSPTFNKAGK